MSFGGAGPKIVSQSQLSNPGVPFRPVNYVVPIPNQNYNCFNQNQMQIVNRPPPPPPFCQNIPQPMVIHSSITPNTQPIQIMQSFPNSSIPIYQNPQQPVKFQTFTK